MAGLTDKEPRWTETQHLHAPGDTHFFGSEGAIDGDTILVSDWRGDAADISQAGVVYVYERSGPTWIFVDRLVSPEPESNGYFGFSVAIEGDIAIVGAVNEDSESGFTDAGAAYVFERGALGWSLVSDLTPEGLGFHDSFGKDVSVSNGTLLVGAPLQGRGRAYVFTESEDGWEQASVLSPPEGADAGRFGHSVGISRSQVLVGSPGTDTEGRQNTGSVHVFLEEGGAWYHEQQLTPSPLSKGDRFGGNSGLVVDNSYALIGSSGETYAYDLTGQSWQLTDRIEIDADPSAIDGNLALLSNRWADTEAGDGTGVAYIVERSTGGWERTAQLIPQDVEAADRFQGLGLDGRTVVGGATGAEASAAGMDLGLGHVFQLCSEQTLLPEQFQDRLETAPGSAWHSVVTGVRGLNCYVDGSIS